MATGEPSPDSRRARPRPMPDAAPVITTGRPAILRDGRGIGSPSRCGWPGGPRRDGWQCVSGPAANDGAASLGPSVGHATRMPTLAGLVGRHQGDLAQHGTQDDVHLHVRERGAQAAPGAAAERDPLVQVRPCAEEAVWIERPRVRERDSLSWISAMLTSTAYPFGRVHRPTWRLSAFTCRPTRSITGRVRCTSRLVAEPSS